jgi:hypothetical protein
MEKINDFYNQYFDQGMAWYNGLPQLYQYGVLFLLGVIGLFVISYFTLSRITK